jgi:hypothetical protein
MQAMWGKVQPPCPMRLFALTIVVHISCCLGRCSRSWLLVPEVFDQSPHSAVRIKRWDVIHTVAAQRTRGTSRYHERRDQSRRRSYQLAGLHLFHHSFPPGCASISRPSALSASGSFVCGSAAQYRSSHVPRSRSWNCPNTSWRLPAACNPRPSNECSPYRTGLFRVHAIASKSHSSLGHLGS